MTDTASEPEDEDIVHEDEETDADPTLLTNEELDEVDPNSEIN